MDGPYQPTPCSAQRRYAWPRFFLDSLSRASKTVADYPVAKDLAWPRITLPLLASQLFPWVFSQGIQLESALLLNTLS